MKIKNIKTHFLEESILRSGYPMTIGEPQCMYNEFGDFKQELLVEKDRKRFCKLANTPNGSGHDCSLKGVIVQFDLCYTQYITKQIQRYNWVDYISSQSQMHRLVFNRDIKGSCNKYVLPATIGQINTLISIYNKDEYPVSISNNIVVKNKSELFHYIISNCPMGYELWVGVSTNYLQLKNIWKQRCENKHKLEDWEVFGEFIKKLPMSNLITG